MVLVHHHSIKWSPFFSVRSQKQLGLIGGLPSYEPMEGFQKPEATARTYVYSPDGKLLAYAIPSGWAFLCCLTEIDDR